MKLEAAKDHKKKKIELLARERCWIGLLSIT